MASQKFPSKKRIVALVTPHPGHGIWYINLEGQTTILVCPSFTKNSQMHTIIYAKADNMVFFLVEISLQFIIVLLFCCTRDEEPINDSPNA